VKSGLDGDEQGKEESNRKVQGYQKVKKHSKPAVKTEGTTGKKGLGKCRNPGKVRGGQDWRKL